MVEPDHGRRQHSFGPGLSEAGTPGLTEKVLCQTCGKLYASKKSLKIHIRIHTGYKPYACKICPKRFTQTNVLKAHINSHTGQRDWKCRFCQKAFTQSAHLRTHEKIHLHVKDYVCGYCHQSFGSKGVRDRHIRQHTGEKPYKCGVCSKAFTRGESLKFHENAHQGIRPFRCVQPYCSSTFTKQSSLKRHVSSCHGSRRHEIRFSDGSSEMSHAESKHSSDSSSYTDGYVTHQYDVQPTERSAGHGARTNVDETMEQPISQPMGFCFVPAPEFGFSGTSHGGMILDSDCKQEIWSEESIEHGSILVQNPFEEFVDSGWSTGWDQRMEMNGQMPVGHLPIWYWN